jgi:hypothetical protein
MNSAGPWTTNDFDAMSWHDVHVHEFRLDGYKESEGSADLILDIDYILKWDNHLSRGSTVSRSLRAKTLA